MLAVFVTFLPSASAAIDLPSHIERYFALEDLTDSTGNGSLTASGATGGATGIIENAYSFDGASDRLTDADVSIAALSDFTINVWFYADVAQTAGDYNILFDWADAATTEAGKLYYSGFSNDQFTFFSDTSIQADDRYDITAPASLENGWHMFTLVFDQGNKVYAYIDASIVDAAGEAMGTTSYVNTNQDLVLGDRPYSTSEGFDGSIDEVALWSRVLTQEEITSLYAGGSPGSGQQYPFLNILEITASDFYSGATINNFDVTFTNGSFFSTTTGNITLANWTNGNYTFTLSADNYISNTTSFEHINQSSINVKLYPDNRLEFWFYDEPTRNTIKNVTFYLRGDSFSDNRSINTGYYNYSSLPTGSYEIRYGFDNSTHPSPYDPRSYYFIIPLTLSNANISLFLANETQTTTFVPTVVDQDYSPIVDSYIAALRYYPDINQYLTVEMAAPDQQQGQTIMNLFFNTVAYKFRVYQNNTLLYEDDIARYLADQTLTFTINTEGLLSLPFSQCEALQSNLTFINSTTTFRWSYTDTSDYYDQYCLSVVYRYGTQEETNTSCSVNPDSIILVAGDPVLPGTYVATAKAFGTVNCIAGTAEKSRTPGKASFGLFGVLIGLLGVIISFTVALKNPAIGIFLGIGVLFGVAGTFLGITAISVVWLSTLLVIGIIIVFITKT